VIGAQFPLVVAVVILLLAAMYSKLCQPVRLATCYSDTSFRRLTKVGEWACAILISLSATAWGQASCPKQSAPITVNQKPFLLAEGDSITFGQASTDGKGSYVQRAKLVRTGAIEAYVAAKSQAVLGSENDLPGANSLYGRMKSDNGFLPTDKVGRLFIFSMLIGRNDLVGYYGGANAYSANVAAYVRKLRDAGWDRVVLGTLLPSDWAPFTAVRQGLNSIFDAPCWASFHDIDSVADFASSQLLGPDSAAASHEFFADGIHPNNQGYEAMAPIFDSAISSLISFRK
jgi:hypothetical protein